MLSLCVYYDLYGCDIQSFDKWDDTATCVLNRLSNGTISNKMKKKTLILA